MKNFLRNNIVGVSLIACGLLLLSCAAFAAQIGIGGTPLKIHNHSGSSQGGNIQALALSGNFFVSGNNEGNIIMGATYTGSHFIWYPAKQNLFAGFNSSGFHPKNMTSTINLGTGNTCGSYSVCAGYALNSSEARFNAGLYGNNLLNTANNAFMFGDGANIWPYSVNNATGTVKIFSGAHNPSISIAQASGWTDPGAVTLASTTINGSLDVKTITLNGAALTASNISTGVALASSQTFTGSNTMTGPLTLSGSSLTVTGDQQFTGDTSFGSSGHPSHLANNPYGYNMLQGTDVILRSAAAGNIYINNETGGSTSIQEWGGAFSVGGSTFVVTSGKVGIGVSPTIPLQLASTMAGNWGAILSNDSATGFGAKVVGGSSASNKSFEATNKDGTPLFDILGNGNVGIGTTAPATKLHVSNGVLTVDGTGAGFAISAMPATGVLTCWGAGNKIGYCESNATCVTCTVP